MKAPVVDHLPHEEEPPMRAALFMLRGGKGRVMLGVYYQGFVVVRRLFAPGLFFMGLLL
jgi:hypothetical protein